MKRSKHKDYFVFFPSSFTLFSFLAHFSSNEWNKSMTTNNNNAADTDKLEKITSSSQTVRYCTYVFFRFLLFFISSVFDFRSYTRKNSKLEIGKLSCCCSAAQYGKREKKIYFQEMKMLKNELPNVIICWNFYIFNFPISPLSFAGVWRTKRHNMMPNQTWSSQKRECSFPNKLDISTFNMFDFVSTSPHTPRTIPYLSAHAMPNDEWKFQKIAPLPFPWIPFSARERVRDFSS